MAVVVAQPVAIRLGAPAAVGFGVVVGQGRVVDRLADLGLVRVLEQPQVVDAGGLDRRGGVGFDRGVHVAADVVRGGACPWAGPGTRPR